MVSDYTGPMRAGAPAGSPSQYTDPKQIDAILKSSDPGAVAAAGRSYQKFAQAYEKISGHLLSLRDDLHEAWGGNDAAAAQSQLREVWSAATTIHKTANAFGSAIETHGSEYLAWYKNNKPPSTSLAEAQSWMTGANERVSQSWSSLPPDLSTTLPPGGERQGLDFPKDGSSGGSGGSRGSGPAGHGGSHISDSVGHLPHDHSDVGGSGTELAGFSSPDGGTTSAIGAPPGGGTPPPLSSGGGYVYGSGAVPPGGGIICFESGSVPTPGATVSGGPQGREGSEGRAGATAREAAAAEAEAGVRPASTVGPMVGGSRAEERERTRQSWGAEDEDLWTGDIEASPETIGATEPSTAEGRSAVGADPTVENDLADDGDELAAVLAALSDHSELSDIELGDDVEGVDGTEPGPSRGEQADVSARIAELREELTRLERQRDAERPLPPIIEETRSEYDWRDGDGL
jgi:hypothetical protein